jgi:hypothetical protein
METAGLVLNALGAIVVAAGQEYLFRGIRIWLLAHEVTIRTLLGGSNTVVGGGDRQHDRSELINRRVARVGWMMFVVGIVLQLLARF